VTIGKCITVSLFSSSNFIERSGDGVTLALNVADHRREVRRLRRDATNGAWQHGPRSLP